MRAMIRRTSQACERAEAATATGAEAAWEASAAARAGAAGDTARAAAIAVRAACAVGRICPPGGRDGGRAPSLLDRRRRRCGADAGTLKQSLDVCGPALDPRLGGRYHLPSMRRRGPPSAPPRARVSPTPLVGLGTMIFTTKAEYGVRLLVELGRHHGERAVSLKAISEAEGLPLAYLERIVALLRKAALVESTRGAHGGYRLARDPATIHMDEAVLALEGAVAPMSCFVDDSEEGRVLCSHVIDHGHGCATKLLWTRVQGGVIKALAQTTLAELVAFHERQLVPAPREPVGA